MKTVDTATRFLGNCQLCECDFKVQDGRMVHHGYKRPGIGSIIGDCVGVHEVPYETSCDLIKVALERTIVQLTFQRDHLAKLRSNQITHIAVQERDYSVGSSRSPGAYKTVSYVAGVTPFYKWIDTLASEIRRWERAVEETEFFQKRYEARIAAWKLLPLRTWEEELVKVQATKDAAKAVLEAKRATRKAKEDAKVAKKAALVARREAEAEALATFILQADDRGIYDLVYKIKNGTKYQWLRYSYDQDYQVRFLALCGKRLQELNLTYVAEHNGQMYLK